MDKTKRKRKRAHRKKGCTAICTLNESEHDNVQSKKLKQNEGQSDSIRSSTSSSISMTMTKQRKRKRRKRKNKDDGSGNVLAQPENVESKRRDHNGACLNYFSDQQHTVGTSGVINVEQNDPEHKTQMWKCQRETSNTKNVKKRHSLEERLKSKLESGRFRWINEKLYTSSSQCASELFEKDPALFNAYHQGFSSQVQKWPVNPVDVMIKWIKQRSPKLIIVDMGCGEAKIAQNVPNKVYSFDLVAANNFVTSCDMAKVPLQNSSVDVVIYCLSLMGTNLSDFLKEAYRILKNGGVMNVAEVASRFGDMKNFEEAVSYFGFSLQSKDTTNKMFVQFEFTKLAQNVCFSNTSSVSLKPCFYKKR